MLFVKVTFFLLYLQLFRPMRWLKTCAYIGAVFTVMFYLGMTVAQLTFSTPRHGETWLSHQVTHNENLALAMSVPQSVVGLAIDLYILILPIIAVSQLQLAPRKKVGVMLIFMTGLLYEDTLPPLKLRLCNPANHLQRLLILATQYLLSSATQSYR